VKNVKNVHRDPEIFTMTFAELVAVLEKEPPPLSSYHRVVLARTEDVDMLEENINKFNSQEEFSDSEKESLIL